ncbi:unnamed protein product [Rotaria socialis]|uniref:Uncharacterized protein n=1 Tax=Rotaria socialis TaxID=392032 RepID=A0A817WBB4_9BILA|nr:unnamed protein product [Rotaria socialis]
MSTEYFRILLYSYNLSALKRRSSVGRQDQRQYANELSQPRLGSNKLCISKILLFVYVGQLKAIVLNSSINEYNNTCTIPPP